MGNSAGDGPSKAAVCRRHVYQQDAVGVGPHPISQGGKLGIVGAAAGDQRQIRSTVGSSAAARALAELPVERGRGGGPQAVDVRVKRPDPYLVTARGATVTRPRMPPCAMGADQKRAQ